MAPASVSMGFYGFLHACVGTSQEAQLVYIVHFV